MLTGGAGRSSDDASGSVSDAERTRLTRAVVNLERSVRLFMACKQPGPAGVAFKTLGMAATLMNRVTDAIQ